MKETNGWNNILTAIADMIKDHGFFLIAIASIIIIGQCGSGML